MNAQAGAEEGIHGLFHAAEDVSVADGQIDRILRRVRATGQRRAQPRRLGGWWASAPDHRMIRAGVGAACLLGTTFIVGIAIVVTGARTSAPPRVYDGVFDQLGSVCDDVRQHDRPYPGVVRRDGHRLGGPVITLPDGRVMLWSDTGVKARVFDPTTNAFTPAVSSDRLSVDQALPLADGRVLVGGEADLALRGLDILDPATGEIEPITELPDLTSTRIASLADGRALVLGRDERHAEDEAWVPTPWHAWVLDPATLSVEPVARGARTVVGGRAIFLVDGRVLILGDPLEGGGAQLIDLALGTIVDVGDPDRFDVSGQALPLADGRVLLLGEHPRGVLFDPGTGSFTDAGPLAGPMTHVTDGYGTALLPDGRVLVVGGITPPGARASSESRIWDPVTGVSSSTDPLNRPRGYHSMVRLSDDRLLVVGGAGDGALMEPPDDAFVGLPFVAEAEVFDPGVGRFDLTGELSEGRALPRLVPLSDGRVLVAGSACYNHGCDDRPALRTAEIYH